MFFLSIRELVVAGTAFLLDFAAAVYAIRALKGMHPYWEMQLPLLRIVDITVFDIGYEIEYHIGIKVKHHLNKHSVMLYFYFIF